MITERLVQPLSSSQDFRGSRDLGQLSLGQATYQDGNRAAEFSVLRAPRHKVKIWYCKIRTLEVQREMDDSRGRRTYVPVNTSHTATIHF